MGYYKQQQIDVLEDDNGYMEPANREQMEYELAEYDIDRMTIEELKGYALETLMGRYKKYNYSDLIIRYEDLFYPNH